MNKQSTLKVVNMGLALTFICVVMSAILKIADLIPFEIYGYVHVLPGFALTIFGVMHITLNQNWIKNNYFKKGNK